jgi:hypothetical protein
MGFKPLFLLNYIMICCSPEWSRKNWHAGCSIYSKGHTEEGAFAKKLRGSIILYKSISKQYNA